ncbi:hypothetical protein IT397_00025 [Candidatus Nomurabacteria bacterium]|nr:hypothetical protein [Candidatus Nomurabacteria bacterium]
MIYLFYGKKNDEAREKANKTITSLVAKKPDSALFKIEAENWNSGQIMEYAEAKGLFSEKYIVFLDNVFEGKEAKDWFFTSANLKIISESGNIFIILEKKLDKVSLEKIKKNNGKIQEFNDKSEKEEDGHKEKYNVFLITNAIEARDKKKAWIFFREAVDAGVSMEEICGSFFWKMKTMITNIRFVRNYTEKELKNMAFNLASIYHDAHLGLLDFELSLEKFILSI